MTSGKTMLRLALVVILVSVLLLLAADAAWGQAGPVDREEGGTPIGILKVALFFLLFVVVALTGNWVAHDVPVHQKQQDMWFGIFVGGAVLALLLVLMVPVFAVGLVLALGAVFGPFAAYVSWRNKLVPPQAKAFTPKHIRQSLLRMLKREALGAIAADRAVHIGGAAHLTEGSQLLYMTVNDMPVRLKAQSEEELAAFARGEQILTDALRRQAGQLYLVPAGSSMLVRTREGGVLREAGKIDKKLGDGVVRFIKRLASLSVDEHRKPQTGRFIVLLNDKPTNVTVQTAGSVKGEHLVAKLHARELLKMHLADSGMRKEQVELFHKALRAPGGVILMSAPRHNGRTVSMYAALRELDLFAKNVVAVEQDITIEVPDVHQVEVNKASGQTLGGAVQDVLRGDPDVVMVETIPDAETAQMLLTGATLGKVMIGGLIAADASEAVESFLKLAGNRQNVAATLLGATGQRLLRTLCAACREAYRPNPEFLRKANLQVSEAQVLYREPKMRPVNKKGEPMVCPMCGNEGYVGRTALYEVMVLDDRARQELAAGRSVGEIRTMLRKQGQEFLQEEGLRKVVDGATSVSELLRVLRPGK